MSLSHEAFRDRLVDYLYGELEGEELREFEAKLAESEECQHELDTLRQTLDLSREGLALATDDAPPVRVRAAVLAAAEAREARHQMPTASPGRAPPTPERGEDQVGRLWAWLRAPWLLPTMGVCAAVAVVVLGRRIETPQVERVHDEPASTQQAAPSSEESPQEVRPGGPTGLAPSEAPKAEHSADFEDEASRRPEPTALQPSSEGRLRARSGGASKGAAPARAEPAAKPKASRPEQEEFSPSRGYATPPPAWEALRGPERRATDGVAEGEAPHAARAEAKEAHADKAVSAAKRRTEASDRDLSGYGSLGGGGSVAAESAAPPAAAPAAPSSRAASAPADDARDRTSADSARAPDESVKRAREHSANKRWGQAAVAYRELLQRYPSDPRVPAWRRQLTEAAQALSNVDAVR